MSREVLYIFSAEFPYGFGETFLENELPIYASKFDTIYLCPLKRSNTVERNFRLPPNVCVKPYDQENSVPVPTYNLLTIFFLEFLNQSGSKKIALLKSFRFYIAVLKHAFSVANWLESNITSQSNERYYLYSCWLNEWALALSILKRKQLIQNFISRAGGYDIWDERYPGNYLPFRYFLYKYLSKLYVNNLKGRDYCRNFGFFPEKIELAYLGTNAVHGVKSEGIENEVVIVSCSHLIPLKRVDIIAKALSLLKVSFHWHHFGDGPEMSNIKRIIKEMHLSKVTLHGTVTNKAILDFYQSEPVHIFITCSETEGLPISIQEALSAGIPIIATPVGGIPEMVNNETGALLVKNPSIEEVARAVEKIIEKVLNGDIKKNGIIDFWKKHFDRKKTYVDFAQKIEAQAINFEL